MSLQQHRAKPLANKLHINRLKVQNRALQSEIVVQTQKLYFVKDIYEQGYKQNENEDLIQLKNELQIEKEWYNV